ncbi:MAG: hypothetical protein Q8922_06505 [Bacteroidota bacterium]|nr:hypothetical protein [Bacteroidota bacterium]MDP4233809.1 hypothetical protein [Bacteroidota bacterium]MDP4242448.1 hypothetical protein [Bacteroidota bacterium]MDP4287570.1 hypothetical protein [Bacteroidota bacterium]
MEWRSEWDSRLKNPGVVRELLEVLASDPGQTFDLLFHADFADRLLGVMRQAGPQSEGFGRMQQTFAETVEKIRSLIVLAASNGFSSAGRYTDLTPAAMSSILDLSHDLSMIKHSQMA